MKTTLHLNEFVVEVRSTRTKDDKEAVWCTIAQTGKYGESFNEITLFATPAQLFELGNEIIYETAALVKKAAKEAAETKASEYSVPQSEVRIDG